MTERSVPQIITVKALRVSSWSKHYETAESKRIKTLLWVATPNGHDSVCFRRLLRHPNGMAHYGAWNLILQTASKCSPRGLLMFGGDGHREPHTADTIADITGAPASILSEAIGRLLQLGWLEEVELDSQQTAGQAQRTAGQATSTGEGGQDTTGEGGKAPPSFEILRKALQDLGLPGNGTAPHEWARLAGGRARCKDREEALQFIGWAVRRGLRDGSNVQYAKHAALYADEWASKPLKPLESKESGLAGQSEGAA